MSGRSWSASEVVAAARAHNEALEAEQSWLEQQLAQHKRDLHKIDGESEDAWQHLLEVVVPELSGPHLDRAAAAFQLPSIAGAAVASGMQREADRLRQRVAEIDADTEYAQREGIVNECEIRVAELDEMIAPLSASTGPVFADPSWRRLWKLAYGLPEYGGKWYQLSYYRDWKEADELVERHGPRFQATDYVGLRAKVREAEAAMVTLQSERNDFHARRGKVEGLVRARAEAEQALAALPTRQLAAVRGRLRGHLEPLGFERVAALLPGDPTVAVALQRLAGLAAKRRYLEETAKQYLQGPHAQIEEAQLRNRRDIEKLSRPKNYGRQFAGETMEKRFRDRSAAVAKRRQRYEDTRTQVVHFNSYERGSLVSDFLWWDVMTDGRLDGNFIHEVHHHHSHHGPGHHVHHDHHADAVAAVADGSGGDDGLLLHDGS